MKSTKRLICLALTLLLALSLSVPAFADTQYASTQAFLDGIKPLDGLHYTLKSVMTDTSGNSLEQVDLLYKGDKAERAFHITAFFPEECDSVLFRIQDLLKAESSEELGELLVNVNMLNSAFSWVKFYVDDNSSVTAEMDILATPDSIALIGVNALVRLIPITEQAYKFLTSAE